MVKFTLIIGLLLFIHRLAVGQVITDTSSIRLTEIEYNQQSTVFLNNLNISYDVLTGWGLGNVVISGAALNTPNGKENYGPFWRMNLAWGGVNAIIGGYSIYQLHKLDRTLAEQENYQDRQATLAKVVKMQRKIFGIAALLDVGFIATGAAMAIVPKEQDVKQFGYSIVIQSAFLLAFDATMYQYLGKKRSALQPHFSPAGMGIIYRF